MPYQSRLLRNSKQPLWVRAGLVSLWRFEDAANLGKDDRNVSNLANTVVAQGVVSQGVGKVGGSGYNGGLGRAFPWGPSSYAGVA